MKESQPVIVAEALTKRFGDFTAVDSVDFQVSRGEIFGFLGPNGSGKTTTIRMMLGLLRPTSGRIEILGRRVTDLPSEIRSRVGYMSQRFSLYNDITVHQNLRFYGKAYGLSAHALPEAISHALEMSGLAGREHVRTRDLAGGWRQRLALSAAIIHRPAVIFLDEPTAGVDPVSRRAFWDLLYQLSAQQVAIFVTTHYMDEAEHCHRLAFIRRGRLIAVGRPEEIKHTMLGGRVWELAPSDPARAVEVLRAAQQDGRLPLEEVALYGSLVHVVAPDRKNAEKAIAIELRQALIDPGQMTAIEPSLEDVFIACMR